MSSSESDTEPQDSTTPSRLGECEVCGDKEAIYSCPKCELKTCCLKCVRIHKQELECDGVRDRTKFIRMKNFSDTDLLSDYRLLEECARFVYAVKRDEKKKFTRVDKDLPIHLYKLKMAARKRGTVLQFLAQNFTRHSINTTRYNYKTNIIHWRIEWVFPNAEDEPVKFVDEKCPEQNRLSTLIDKYLNPAVSFEGSKKLTYYKSVGFGGVKVLLRAEKVKGSNKKFFELDPSESLMENLSGKCVVEFPIIFIMLKDHAYNIDIVAPEEEFDYNKDGNQTDKFPIKHHPTTQINPTQNGINNPEQSILNDNQYNSHRKRTRPLLTEKIAEQKRQEIEKEIKEVKRKKPKNLLFTTGYSSEEDLELSEDEEKK